MSFRLSAHPPEDYLVGVLLLALLVIMALSQSCIVPDEVHAGTTFADHPPFRRYEPGDSSFMSYSVGATWYVRPREVVIIRDDTPRGEED